MRSWRDEFDVFVVKLAWFAIISAVSVLGAACSLVWRSFQ